MFIVKIINDNEETLIHNNSINEKSERISGTIKQGINTIDSFTFTILPNNKGYNLIKPLRTLIKVYNTITQKYEFIGRVLKPSKSMSSSGLISKTYICESQLAYLLDTTQEYEMIQNISVKGYLKKLLDIHNSKTDTYKRFELGVVTVNDNNDSIYRYISYDTTKKNIEDDLIEKLGGELQIRHENNILYLDYLTEIGKECTTEIRLGKNIKDLTEDTDPTSYKTRIIPLGSKIGDSEERLTIRSVNNNKNYIEDSEAIKEFGTIEGIIIFDDVTDGSNLYKKGKEYLASQKILISNKITALDLSLLGLDIHNFEVANTYPLVHDILDINYKVRIVEKTIDINKPHTSSITLGDKQKDIKQYQLEAKKEAEKNKKIEETIKIQNNKINVVNNNINTTKEELTIEVNKQVETLTNTIKDLEERIKLLEGDTNG